MELTWSKDNTPFADLQKVPISHAIIKCRECGESIRVESKDGNASIPAEFHDQHLPHGSSFEVKFGMALY